MKNELMKQIMPILENFVDKFLSSFEDVQNLRKDLEQREADYNALILQKDGELAEIRAQKIANKADFDKQITELGNTRNDCEVKTREYDILIADLKKKEQEIADNLAKTRIELMNAKQIREEAAGFKDESAKTLLEYKAKLDSLKTDEELLKKKKQENEAELAKLHIREEQISIIEKSQKEHGENLKDLELKVKAERKEVDRLIKRYNLEAAIKE